MQIVRNCIGSCMRRYLRGRLRLFVPRSQWRTSTTNPAAASTSRVYIPWSTSSPLHPNQGGKNRAISLGRDGANGLDSGSSPFVASLLRPLESSRKATSSSVVQSNSLRFSVTLALTACVDLPQPRSRSLSAAMTLACADLPLRMMSASFSMASSVWVDQSAVKA